MPDGDTLHRAAAALRIALVGQIASRFDATVPIGPHPTPGRRIESVEAHGRRLDIVWDDGLTLHTNMRLSGVWHLYRGDEMWRRPSASMRVAVSTDDWVAVCFGAPIVETFRQFDPQRHPAFGRLGPDLARSPERGDDVVQALFEYDDPHALVAEALLDLHVARGIGNAYRSETLWALGIHSAARLDQLDDDEIVELVARATELVGAHTRPNGRATPPLAVYRRTGQPCTRCRDAIEERPVGAQVLFWCPGCQTRHDPSAVTPPGLEMDRHPAAVKFLADLPWRRDPLAG